MIARTYYTENKVLKFGLEDIYRQFKNDYFIDSYDFVIFAINPDYPYQDINYSIKQVLKNDNFVAFNAIDAFCNAEVVAGIAALFIKFERSGKIDSFYQDNFNSTKDVYKYLLNHKNSLNIIISTPSDKVPSFLEKLNKKFKNDDIFLIGGLSSGTFLENGVLAYNYIDNKIIKDGFMVISFDNVEFANGISLGYKPIGPHYKINLAKNNRVYVAEYTDASLIAKKLLNGMNDDITNLWFSPMVVLDDKDGIVDVVRTFKSYKEGEFVEFFGPISNGSYVKLSFATEEMLLNSDKREAEKIKEKLKEIELGFNFSCVARQFALGKRQTEESALYSEFFNSSVFGFFTFGEIGLNKNNTILKFYNQTSLVCGLKEK